MVLGLNRPSNKCSALSDSRVVTEYLANEVSLGRVADPFDFSPLFPLHISSFGVMPKKGQPGKWRLIVDLSSPGVNNGIHHEHFSLQCIRVDDVIRMVTKHDADALMLKFDVEAAYRQEPMSRSCNSTLFLSRRFHRPIYF